uniref:LigA n=1 Tax=Parastrongyloides trichosuri TaxID=131310 RepID=A0A0N5A091_PARTI
MCAADRRWARNHLLRQAGVGPWGLQNSWPDQPHCRGLRPVPRPGSERSASSGSPPATDRRHCARPDPAAPWRSRRAGSCAAEGLAKSSARRPGPRFLGVQFGGRAGLDADARAVQLGRAGQVERAADHEALPIVVVHAGETEIRSRVAAHGPGRIAPQHVHAPGADGVEPLLRRQRHEAHRIRVAEDGRRRGAAEIDVKAPPGAPVVRIGEADQPLVHAAVQAAALAHRRQGRTILDLGQGRGGARGRRRGARPIGKPAGLARGVGQSARDPPSLSGAFRPSCRRARSGIGVTLAPDLDLHRSVPGLRERRGPQAGFVGHGHRRFAFARHFHALARRGTAGRQQGAAIAVHRVQSGSVRQSTAGTAVDEQGGDDGAVSGQEKAFGTRRRGLADLDFRGQDMTERFPADAQFKAPLRIGACRHRLAQGVAENDARARRSLAADHNAGAL